MPPALWLIVLPIGAVPLVYLLRRVWAGAIVAAATALFSAWLALRLPIGLVLNVLGRTVELDRLSQLTLALLFIATAVLFLTNSFLPLAASPEGRGGGLGRLGRQEGRMFYPVGLAILAVFVAASLSRHLGITAVLIEGAAILTVFVIQGERLESTRAALRFLILMSLATPVLLLAAWQIDLYQLSGGLDSAQNLQRITLFIGIGFALWLAVVPFHGWLTATAAESSPATAAFVLTIFPVVALSTLIHLLADFPWLLNSPQVVQTIIAAGILTACLGGVMASVQRGFSELMGYAALCDLGCTLVLLGVGGRDELVTILVSLTVRALALALVAASAANIRLLTASDGFANVREVAYHLPLATAGLVIGGLTLAGAPFTAGFAPRWHLLQSLAQVDPRWPVLLVLAGLGVGIGYLRGLRATLLPREGVRTKKRPSFWSSVSTQQPRALVITVGLLAAACILLGLFPTLLITPFQTLALNLISVAR